MTENTAVIADWKALLGESHRMLRAAVAHVGSADWDRPTPCDQWTVTQVLQHAAGDQVAYASAITRGPGPSENPFAPSGRIEGDPVAMLDASLKSSAGAFAGIGLDDPEVPTPLPQGAMPAWLAAGACALDAAVHASDIALATGRQQPLTPDVARSLLVVSRNIVEPLRQYGAYAAAIETGADAGDVAVLLGYLGRGGARAA